MNSSHEANAEHTPPPDPPDVEPGELIDRLHEGSLDEAEQKHLAELLESAPMPEAQVVAGMQRVSSFSGPLPHPDLLNKYGEDARRIILEMASEEQAHTHRMHQAGLEGAIQKDRRGQWIGGVIAVTGLAVAAIIAPYSVVAATIIGALDLFGMVALFVAPRLLERRQQSESADLI